MSTLKKKVQHSNQIVNFQLNLFQIKLQIYPVTYLIITPLSKDFMLQLFNCEITCNI